MFRQYDRVIEEMASPTQSLSVVDVYDIAAAIGKEFETIIDNHGPEAVTELMPKVISVLEHLEILAAKNQKENAEIGELRFAVEKLQAEKIARAEQREKYEQVSLYIYFVWGRFKTAQNPMAKMQPAFWAQLHNVNPSFVGTGNSTHTGVCVRVCICPPPALTPTRLVCVT